MRRPTLLLVCLFLLSGCSGITAPGPTVDSPPTVSSHDHSLEDSSVSWPYPGYERGLHSEHNYVVGDPSTARFDGRVHAYVWNASPETRTLNVSLVYGGNETIFQESTQLSANETLGFWLGQSGQYVLTAEYQNVSGSTTVTIDPSDCNDRGYVLPGDQSGTFDDKGISTEIACGS